MLLIHGNGTGLDSTWHEGVFVDLNWLESHVTVVPLSLSRARAIEAPPFQVGGRLGEAREAVSLATLALRARVCVCVYVCMVRTEFCT